MHCGRMKGLAYIEKRLQTHQRYVVRVLLEGGWTLRCLSSQEQSGRILEAHPSLSTKSPSPFLLMFPFPSDFASDHP